MRSEGWKQGRIQWKKFTGGTGYGILQQVSGYDRDAYFQGITTDRRLITLAEKVYNNADLENPIAPSDTVVKLIDFLEQCRKKWGFAKDVYVDNADQATMTELKKYKRLHSCLYNFSGCV